MSEQPWSKGLQLLSDVTAAGWLVAALAPWKRPMATRSLVPAVFSAYARVLPPAEIEGEIEGRRWSWREIAQRTGAVVHAGARYCAVSGWDRQPEAAAPQPWGVPWDGALPPQETLALAAALSAFTSTPQSAYFCVWEGHGDELTNALAGRPARVRAENRNYHLLTGPVAAVTGVSEGFTHRIPSLWWPRDRAWVVATEIDGYNTFVGASSDAVAALLVDPTLEAVPADPGTLLDPSPWPPD